MHSLTREWQEVALGLVLRNIQEHELTQLATPTNHYELLSGDVLSLMKTCTDWVNNIISLGSLSI